MQSTVPANCDGPGSKQIPADSTPLTVPSHDTSLHPCMQHRSPKIISDLLIENFWRRRTLKWPLPTHPFEASMTSRKCNPTGPIQIANHSWSLFDCISNPSIYLSCTCSSIVIHGSIGALFFFRTRYLVQPEFCYLCALILLWNGKRLCTMMIQQPIMPWGCPVLHMHNFGKRDP